MFSIKIKVYVKVKAKNIKRKHNLKKRSKKKYILFKKYKRSLN